MLLKSYQTNKVSGMSSADPLMKIPQYFAILELLNKFKASNITKTFAGNCISTCEVMQSILAQHGIETIMIEVQLLITRHADKDEFLFIGYDSQTFSGSIDTHTVLITKTTQPLLIDLSLGHVLPEDRCFIIERADPNDRQEILCEINIESLHLIYTKKRVPRLAFLHQRNVIEQSMQDAKLRKDFSVVRLLVFVACSLGLINFLANSVLIALKLIFP